MFIIYIKSFGKCTELDILEISIFAFSMMFHKWIAGNYHVEFYFYIFFPFALPRVCINILSVSTLQNVDFAH